MPSKSEHSQQPDSASRSAVLDGVERNWYRSPVWNFWLLPLHWLFWLAVLLRRLWFAVFPAEAVSVPVIVVGNISVGGTGKTPLILWLVERAKAMNLSVGVVSRGYGGQSDRYPLMVEADTLETECGDEPKLIAQRTGCPVVVDPIRRNAVQALAGKVDLILSDDGLQHYAMPRVAEIVVVDGERGLGNQWMLPIGPLREPESRLEQADLVVVNGKDFVLQAQQPINAETGELVDLLEFEGKQVHGVAGIGNPKRFFSTLTQLGMDVIEHPFPDHHPFQPEDLAFDDELPVLMTEKDWVKCRAFVSKRVWYLPVDAVPVRSARYSLDNLLQTWGEKANG
jgi:tetraacyldisaccharide 4'-kinase